MTALPRICNQLSPRQRPLAAGVLGLVLACTAPNPSYRAGRGDAGGEDAAASGSGSGGGAGEPGPGGDGTGNGGAGGEASALGGAGGVDPAAGGTGGEATAVGGTGGEATASGGAGGTQGGEDAATPGSGGGAEGSGGIGGQTGIADAAATNPDTRPYVPSGANLTNGMVGYWKLDMGAGQGFVVDESGTNNQGSTVAIDVETDWVAGKFNNGLSLHGTDGAYVAVKPSPSIDAIQTFSICAWVNRTAAPSTGTQTVLSRQTTASAETYNLSYSHDRLVLYLPYSATKLYSATSSTATPLNQWIHVAATYDGATARIYENGQQTGMLAYVVKLPATTNPVLIGNNTNISGAHSGFIGILDEVLLYSVALSGDAVRDLAHEVRPAR